MKPGKTLEKIFIFCIYSISFLIISYTLSIKVSEHGVLIFILLFLNSIIVPIVFFIKKISILEPIFWFSIYYYILVLSEFLYLYLNFDLINITSTYFYSNIHSIFIITIFLIFIGYASFAAGYFLFRPKIIFSNKQLYLRCHSLIIFVIAIFSLLIALVNFIYNTYILTHLNIISYFQNLAYYASQLKNFGLTTIGYNFMHIAIFLFAYLFLIKRLNRLFFLLALFIYIIILASLGRITYTITLLAVLFLFFLYYKKEYYLNLKLTLKILTILALGLILFSFRMYTSFARVYNINFYNFIDYLNAEFFSIFFGKGNLPNVGIIMKIIDSWSTDIGFLFGKSLPLGLLVFIPSKFSTPIILNYSVSWLAKKYWYEHIPGGGLPPTIIGELYANFGLPGIIMGMFFLGALSSLFYNYVIKSSNFGIFIFYLFFLVQFMFILPKGEFSRLSFILIPFLIIFFYIFCRILQQILSNQENP